MRPKSSRDTHVSVNQKANSANNKRGTRLIPLVLQRTGTPVETFFVPECLECGKPILDFRAANVSTIEETDADLVPIGRLEDADAFLIPSAGAFAVHKDCDATSGGSWVGAHCVFRNDQRREFEKRRAP
jgi:hypothetical protein